MLVESHLYFFSAYVCEKKKLLVIQIRAPIPPVGIFTLQRNTIPVFQTYRFMFTYGCVCQNQECGAMKIFDGCGAGKAFRVRLQVRRPEGAPAIPALAPHILNIDPLKSVKFDPLQGKIQAIQIHK